MQRNVICLIGLGGFLFANPIAVQITSEFTTSVSGTEQIEYRALYFPSYDTIFSDFPLEGRPVVTVAGTAYIDTELTLPGNGCVVIDPSMLSGPFYLPPTNGYFHSFGMEEMSYPDTSMFGYYIPAPPPYASTARFYKWVYDTLECSYYPFFDWYIDYSPTLGSHNNSYIGCSIDGIIYGVGNPIADAMVVAEIGFESGYNEFYICHPEPYYESCTTYTSADGHYHFDSLLPYYYRVVASAAGYETGTQYTDRLSTLSPVTQFDFYLETSHVEEMANTHQGIKVWPNPFKHALHVTIEGGSGKGPPPAQVVRVFDIHGRLIKSAVIEKEWNWDGTDEYGIAVPKGVYFLVTSSDKIKGIKL